MSRLVVLGLVLSVTAGAWADAGLDLVVLLDRSTSMGRRSESNAVLLILTFDLLARNAAANRVEHRLAVIGFGSSPTVELGFTAVRKGHPGLRAKIEALEYQDRGETDMLAALALAEKLFLALPPSPARRRAIVLITDGVPYVRGADMLAYRSRLRRFVTRNLTDAGITMDVLLIDSQDGAEWDGLARVERSGHAAEELLPRAHGVITRLVGTQTAESAPAKTNPAIDTLVVPPYLEIVVLDIFRASPNAQIEIFPPSSATPLRAGVNGIESVPLGDVLATLVVPRPQPGVWTIRKARDDARVRILSQQFFPRGVLLRPGEGETVRRCDRVPLAYRVVDGNGRPIEELPDYALSVEVTLSLPSGASAAVAMERDRALGTGVFHSSRDVFCERAGRYWTNVRVTTTDANGHRIDVFRDRWSGFTAVESGTGRCDSARPGAIPRATWAERTPWIVVATVLAAVGAALTIRRKTKS